MTTDWSGKQWYQFFVAFKIQFNSIQHTLCVGGRWKYRFDRNDFRMPHLIVASKATMHATEYRSVVWSRWPSAHCASIVNVNMRVGFNNDDGVGGIVKNRQEEIMNGGHARRHPETDKIEIRCTMRLCDCVPWICNRHTSRSVWSHTKHATICMISRRTHHRCQCKKKNRQKTRQMIHVGRVALPKIRFRFKRKISFLLKHQIYYYAASRTLTNWMRVWDWTEWVSEHLNSKNTRRMMCVCDAIDLRWSPFK